MSNSEYYDFFDVDNEGPETLAQRAARRARRRAGGLGVKDGSLTGALRQRLEVSRDALQAAHLEILRLLEGETNADDKSTTASRRAALDRLDSYVRKGGGAQTCAPIAAGGGAFGVSFARAAELKRLRSLQ